MVKVLIGADIAPTRSNYKYFQNADVEYLIGTELIDIFREHCFRLLNLETPLTDTASPILKSGQNFYAPTNTIEAIKLMNPSLLTLANNHILDQGVQGINSTIEILNKNSIHHVGVGKNLTNAVIPYILEKDGIKIGVYACAEHEFSIATETKAGANPFDQLESIGHIASLKSQCDYVIILYHGGKEYYRYPSPLLQKYCKKMADNGADVIVCQHSHCIGSFEKYNKSTIIYGQGNFLFDNSDSEFWKTSLLLSVSFDGNVPKVNYIPIIKCDDKVRLADKSQSNEIIKSFYERSEYILHDGFVVNEYKDHAKKMYSKYLIALLGDNLIIRIMNKLFKRKLLNMMYSKIALLKIMNYFMCEAHRELIIASLEDYLNLNG